MPPSVGDTRRVYEANAVAWDQGRDRSLFEKNWLDRFLAATPAGASILDLGCGAGEPIAAYIAAEGRAVTGLDFAASMLVLARHRMPDQRWIEADMRRLDLGETFGGVISWDGFFHLTRDEQRAALPRIVDHIAPDGALLLTVGPSDSDVTGRVGGDLVAHSSLSPEEYEARLTDLGMTLIAFCAEDAEAGEHTILLAARSRPLD